MRKHKRATIFAALVCAILLFGYLPAVLAASIAQYFVYLPIVIKQVPPTQTSTPTNTPTPTQTLTPTPTVTPTPTITLTPVPSGVELNYFVVASDYQTISVKITITNISSSEIILYRLASPTPDAIPPILEINIVTDNGQVLDYTLDSWEGQADRHLQVLNINTGNVNNAVISYSLDLRSQTYWQVTPSYIAVAENQLFFQPDPDNLNVSKMRFEFSVPGDWRVVTRLTPIENGYAANIQDTFRVATYNNNWQRFFLAAPLVLGEFEVIETQFDDIRVLGAYPKGDTQYAADASFVDNIFAYQESILGNPSMGKGDYAILYVFGPRIPSNGGLIPAVVSHGQFEVSHVTDDRHLGHELFHMWYGSGNFVPDAFRFMGVPSWFMEGANEYLGVEAHYATGAFTLAMANQWHNQFYLDYMGIAGTSNDVPVSKCLDSLPAGSSAWYTCLYSKSHTVLFLLDRTLTHYTGQEIGIEDLVRLLYDQYPSEWRGPVTENEILEATSDISGYDFAPFFEAYVTGNVLLPVEIRNGQLEVIWDNLPELSEH